MERLDDIVFFLAAPLLLNMFPFAFACIRFLIFLLLRKRHKREKVFETTGELIYFIASAAAYYGFFSCLFLFD